MQEFSSECGTKRASVNIKYSEIARYWSDKVITNDGCVLLSNDPSRYEFEAIGVVSDVGEPECWRCGLPVRLKSIPSYLNLLKSGDIDCIWNSKSVRNTLERCHIVPYMLGGEETPSNMFLLCGHCHAETPDFVDSKYFFGDIYHTIRSGGFDLGRDKRMIKNALEDFRMSDDDRDFFLSNIDEIRGLIKRSIQESKKMAGDHFGVVAPSTFLALVAETMNEVRAKKRCGA